MPQLSGPRMRRWHASTAPCKRGSTGVYLDAAMHTCMQGALAGVQEGQGGAPRRAAHASAHAVHSGRFCARAPASEGMRLAASTSFCWRIVRLSGCACHTMQPPAPLALAPSFQLRRRMRMLPTQGTERYVPDLELRVLEGCSHWVQQDQPQRVHALMRAFIARTSAPYELRRACRRRGCCSTGQL